MLRLQIVFIPRSNTTWQFDIPFNMSACRMVQVVMQGRGMIPKQMDHFTQTHLDMKRTGQMPIKS